MLGVARRALRVQHGVGKVTFACLGTSVGTNTPAWDLATADQSHCSERNVPSRPLAPASQTLVAGAIREGFGVQK